MLNQSLGVFVSVISHKRPANLPRMADLVGPATWYVGQGELQDYVTYAPQNTSIKESGGLCASRNAALRDAWALGVPCLELSDDLAKLQQPTFDRARDKYVAAPLEFREAVARMLTALALVPQAHLAGVAPTPNPFFYRGKPIHQKAFIVGDMILVEPCGVLFDEQLTLKEDYDYTLQHMHYFDAVARCDDVLATFAHRTNKGGACSVRTDKLEQANIRRLKARWGSKIKDNPKRPNEILIRF